MDDQSIDYRFDRVALTPFQANRLGSAELDDFPVHANTDESFALQFFDYIAELSTLILDQRGEDGDF